MRRVLIAPLTLIILAIVLSINAYSQSRAYVTNISSNNVSVIDIATNVVVDTIPVGNNPHGVAFKSDGSRVYVTNVNDNSVSVIDTASNSVITTIPVGSGPVNLAFTPDGTRAYVANHFSHNVSVINTTTNAVIATVPVQANPQGITITPDGSRAYVANLVSFTVSVIDTATNAVITTVPVESYPIGVTISPNGAEAFVTNIGSGSVSVINTATNTIIATIHVGGEPYVTDFSPDGSRAYVTNRASNSVSVINSATRVVTGTISVGAVPVGIALTSDGNRAYVANFNSHNVSVVDTTTNTVIATIPTGTNTHYIAIWEAPNLDSTPPVITPTVSGTLGNDEWYRSNVSVSWAVTDPDSPVSSSSGCDDANVTADTSGITFSCSATSGGGTGTQSVTIKRDTAAPSIACGSADGAWHASDVSIGCTAGDSVSGLVSSADANFNLTTSVAAETETSNASTGTRQVCDAAGNCSTANSVGGNKVDKKAPTITVSSPTAGNYLLNQAVSVAFSCTDGGSGVADCVGSTANGGALDTGSVGAKTFTLNSADNVGNSAAPIIVNYTVGYGLVVLFDQTRAHKSGSTVPIKVRLVDANGTNVSSASVVLHAVGVIQVSSQASTELDDAGNSNPDFDFRYDTALGGYIFNLKTTGYGTGSYLLNFTAGSSPTVYSVGFQVRQ